MGSCDVSNIILLCGVCVLVSITGKKERTRWRLCETSRIPSRIAHDQANSRVVGRNDFPLCGGEGTRKMARMLPETVRKGEFRRKALTPMPDGRTRWGHPAVFIMSHPTGFWQSMAVPRLEDKVSLGTWKAFLGDFTKRGKAGGGDEEILVTETPQPMAEYPAVKPLTESERKACRNHRPKSTDGGLFLLWDFSSHGGCRGQPDQRPRGKREIIKMKGLRPSFKCRCVADGPSYKQKN